jgi:hypothetical protein
VLKSDQSISVPATFGVLAKRISVWTTKGVLCTLVVIAGLGLGRDVVLWWRSEVVTPSVEETRLPLTDALDDLDQVHELQFGDLPWRFSRLSVTGSKDAAMMVLQKECRQSMLEDASPQGLPGPAEKKLLARLQHQKPIAEERGRWRLYELAGNCPMVAVIRDQTSGVGEWNEAVQSDASNAEKQERAPASRVPCVATEGPRVVTWGLAVPTGKQTWNLYTFAATGKDQKVDTNFPGITTPPGSRRILSLRDPGDGVIISFRGNARPEEWQQFFDDWFQQRKWTSKTSWPSSGPSWHRRYTSGSEEPGGSVDVYFRRNNLGELIGMLTVREIKDP